VSEVWRSYASAPAEGTELCRAEAIPEPGTLGVEPGGFPILLVRRDGRVRAYINACPHQDLPLDYRGKQVLSADGRILRCTNHAAGFDADTGAGADGLGVGCALDPVPVTLREDGVVIVG